MSGTMMTMSVRMTTQCRQQWRHNVGYNDDNVGENDDTMSATMETQCRVQ